MPCPTAAVCAGPPSPAARRLLPHFDVAVEDAEQLRAIQESAARAPLAAATLVQLLRHGEGRGIEAGLMAESWAYASLQAGPELAAWLRARPAPRSPASQGPAVRVERRGARLEVVLDRPERHNAFSAAVRDGLAQALQLALADRSLESIRISGAGPSFCSGGDLDEFGSLSDPATAHAIRSARSVGRLLAACADRTCVAVHGACIGAGVELPAFAARVEAHPHSFFQLPELGMGLVPGAGGTVSLPRRIGRQRTAWLALSQQRIDAPTALAWGLVDAVSERAPAADG